MLDNQGKLYAASHHTKQCPSQTTVPLTCWTTKVNYMQHLTTLSSALDQTTVPLTCWTTKVNYMQHLTTLSSALDQTTVPPTCWTTVGKLGHMQHLTTLSSALDQTTVPLTCWTTKVNYMQHLKQCLNYRSSYMLDNQGKPMQHLPH